MPKRDDFTKATRERLAKRVAYLCSHPNCRRPTIGPAKESDKPVVTGEAAHITAAAPGGPRYNPALSPEERRDQANGIWLCAVHATQVDSDEEHFTVELLRKWKAKAEDDAFFALTSGRARIPTLIPEIDTQVLEALGLKDVDIGILSKRLLEAAKLDLSGFKSTARWPDHAIALTLRTTDLDSPPFVVSGCVAGIQASGELAIVAPPGTGKTTTSIQIVDAILTKGEKIAVFIPLNEWSMGNGGFFESLTHRTHFRNFREQDFLFLALHGRLTLVLDGWNELNSNSRQRAIIAVSQLRRDLPLLDIIITARPQQLGSVLTGPNIQIEGLSENQQLEIARSAYGTTGEQILDRAWRTSGLRELVSIPLYLNALLKEMPTGALPRSKEEILRLFVGQHEKSAEKMEIFRQKLYGFHNDYLRGLAVEATLSGNTAIPEDRSRTVVTAISARLKEAGQISQPPQPSDVLDLLVNHHVLIKSGSGSFSFQHEQIQELYASYEVEALIRKSMMGDKDAKERLLKEILNIPIWEEAILFACERLSYAGDSEINAVSECVIDTLGIDPILAADMIYRSADATWEKVKDRVVEFVKKWHAQGVVDRAVRFMITSGRKEFAPIIWPLITHTDNQISLKALRAANRFRPAVLGPYAATRLLEIPEHIREHVAIEIAYNSGIEGLELAAELAKNDPSPKIRSEIIEVLFYRRADRIAKEVLKAAPDTVWTELAKKNRIDEIVDVESGTRLRLERERLIENEADMLKRIIMLLAYKERSPSYGKIISEIIQSQNFPLKETGWILNHAFKEYPDAVSSALIRRLEAGYDLPMGSREMLVYCNPTDEGPIVEIVLSGKNKKAAMNAIILVGEQTIKHLMDQFISLKKRMDSRRGGYSKEESDDYYFHLDLITSSRLLPFINAWLSYSETDDPVTIALMSDIFDRYRNEYNKEAFLKLGGSVRARIESVLQKWAEILLSSPSSTRYQLSELARAIGRLGSEKLIDVLSRLLAEELAGWRRSREEYRQTIAKRALHRSDLTSYMLLYEKAFAMIGGERTSTIMKEYLRDAEFSFEAACVLKSIYEAAHASPVKDTRLLTSPDFSHIKALPVESVNSLSTCESDIILATVAELLGPDSKEAEHQHALKLATVGLSLPHGDKTELVEKLLALPISIQSKYDILAVLIHCGQIIPASLVMEGVKDSCERGKKEPWRDGNKWLVDRWLALLPFSDKPECLLEAMDLAGKLARPIRYMYSLLKALQFAPGKEIESILVSLARRDTELIGDHAWLSALFARGSITALIQLLDLLCDPSIDKPENRINIWWIARALAGFLDSHQEFRTDLLNFYKNPEMKKCHGLIEQVLAESPDNLSIISMVKYYAEVGRPFDGLMNSAIENIALEKRPVQGLPNAYELHSIDASELRKQLFAFVIVKGPEMPVAEQCLTTIDQLRDQHGHVDFEPRHPDIETGLSWPIILS